MLQNLLIEKLIKEYDYLNSELRYKKAVIDEYLPTLKKIEVSSEPLKEDIVDNVKRIPSEIEKQIYRQISKLTHPDKENSNVDQFNAASIAYSSGNFVQLMKIAHELEIKISIDENTIETIKTQIADLRLQSEMLNEHLIWKWYLTQDSDEKQDLEERIKSI